GLVRDTDKKGSVIGSGAKFIRAKLSCRGEIHGCRAAGEARDTHRRTAGTSAKSHRRIGNTTFHYKLGVRRQGHGYDRSGNVSVDIRTRLDLVADRERFESRGVGVEPDSNGAALANGHLSGYTQLTIDDVHGRGRLITLRSAEALEDRDAR